MSKMTPKSKKFIDEMTIAINSNRAVREVKVYYDASEWTKRDYVADITIDSLWDKYDTQRIKERMREAGATNIIGCVRHAIARDYLDLAFDIKKSKMKELGIDIPKVV